MLLPWFLCGALLIIIIVLCTKIYLLKKNIDEICVQLQEHLSSDTNTLISISSNNKQIRHLATALNKQLRILRSQRHQFFNKNQELKDSVTNISHDLRTPLTAICGYLEMLEGEEKSEDVTRYLSFIKNRTQSLKQLTEELFRYSVITSTSHKMDFGVVNINGVLEESIANFYESFKKQCINPTICISNKKILRNLNKAALSRIFNNLLNNALKYSDGDLEISLLDSGEIIFKNTAAQLNEIQVGQLFDRFFSVEDGRNSTGLGLAISKTLVKQMNGTITANYSDDKLSIHIIFMPDND